jgi:hypothetical protein
VLERAVADDLLERGAGKRLLRRDVGQLGVDPLLRLRDLTGADIDAVDLAIGAHLRPPEAIAATDIEDRAAPARHRGERDQPVDLAQRQRQRRVAEIRERPALDVGVARRRRRGRLGFRHGCVRGHAPFYITPIRPASVVGSSPCDGRITT